MVVLRERERKVEKEGERQRMRETERATGKKREKILNREKFVINSGIKNSDSH